MTKHQEGFEPKEAAGGQKSRARIKLITSSHGADFLALEPNSVRKTNGFHIFLT